MHNPKVSIALATYNGGKFIETQINSLLVQTYANFEIVISDDQSTDNTAQIIQGINDSRIKFFLNPNPKGFQKNFEHAISMCTGEITFLCDQDDFWYKDKIERHIKEYDKDDVVWVHNEVNLVDENLQNIGPLTDKIDGYYLPISLLSQIGGRCILGCSTSYKTKTIQNIGVMSPYAPGHDSWIQLAIQPAKSMHIKEILQDYRQHSNNVFGVRKNKPATQAEIYNNINKSIKYVSDLVINPKLGTFKRIRLFLILLAKIIKFNLRKIIKK